MTRRRFGEAAGVVGAVGSALLVGAAVTWPMFLIGFAGLLICGCFFAYLTFAANPEPEEAPRRRGELATIGEDEFLAAVQSHAELLVDSTEAKPGGSVFEWCEARGVDATGLFRAAELHAEVWAQTKLNKWREDYTDEEWGIVVSGYAYTLAVGIEAERARRDLAELPK